MSRLLSDRYFVDGSRCAWDLATGAMVHRDEVNGERDEDEPPLPALIELLEHGREGVPRWVVADVRAPAKWLPTLHRAARDACARGYIPIAVEMYLRLGGALDEELRDRAVLLISNGRTPVRQARAALLDASARSARPHVLLTLRSRGAAMSDGERGEWPSQHTASFSIGQQRSPVSSAMVREARAAYGAQPMSSARVTATVSRDIAGHLQRGARALSFAASGQHAAAERLLRDVAGALARRGAHGFSSRMLITLGRLLLERGRASAADTVFGGAAAASQAGGDDEGLIAARLWQAAARTDLLQLSAAEALCRAVLVSASLDAAPRAVANATLARVLLWQGRLAEAIQLDLTWPETDQRDCSSMLFVLGVQVRVRLERGELFDAGLCARTMAVAVADGDALGRAMAMTAGLRVAAAAGELELCAERLDAVVIAAREARAPFRAARARLLWVDALVRAGRGREAARELALLRRLMRATPALLRRGIERRLRGDSGARPVSLWLAPAVTAPELIQLVHEVDDDGAAVRGVIERTLQGLQASRMDLCSEDAGPVTAVVGAGSGVASELGPRVLEAGISIGPEARQSGYELGVPVRLGSRLLAAVVARWPVDRTPPSDARHSLELAAAVMAPRVDTMLSVARHAALASTSVPELIGVSPAIVEIRKAIARAAGAPFAVMIEGESGAGKELVARAIHQLGPRRERRFCDVNCAALPDDLFEAELFGHTRGAFTGAVAERVGLFEEADGGTLFMDELADLSPRSQAKLLRVLQQHEIRRLGESFSRKVDVRLVTAANRDMRAEAAAGRFRQDLLYRLDVIRIRVPPLRERPEDIGLLAEHFWRAAAPRVGTRAVLTHAVITALSRYHWPGNVRELQNAVSALAVAAPASGRLRPQLLPAAITGAAAITAGRLDDARAQFERRFIEVALARAGGSRSRAAREIGLSRQGLLKMLARLGLEPREPAAASGT